MTVPIRDTLRVGGRVCLDFTNTVSAWEPAGPDRFTPAGDKLVDYDAFLEWVAEELGPGARRALARTAAKDPRGAEQVLRRALRFRHALYVCLRAHFDGREPSRADLELLSDEHGRAHRHERIAWRRDGFVIEAADDAKPLEMPLRLVVRSAVELLTSGDLGRVKACPGEHCGWLFVDTSKSGRRRWCAMSDCGNLDKVRRFRERREGRPRGTTLATS
jgi:predicted RNA-binding Zn ribbon-like protein